MFSLFAEIATMPSLYDLPDFLLEDIISYVIGDLHDTPNLLFSKTYNMGERGSWKKYENDKRNKSLKLVARPISATFNLLLCSRRIYVLTARIIYLRAVFQINNNDSMEYFLHSMGEERLARVKNMRVEIYTDTDKALCWFRGPRKDPRHVIQRGISLLARLPLQLCRLYLEIPGWEFPSDGACERSARFAAALSRLTDLRQLVLDFGCAMLCLDNFCLPAPSFVDWGIDPGIPVPSSPMFPALRRLSLPARIADTVKPVHFAKALPEDQLPSLEYPMIAGLLFNVDGLSKEEWAFSAEAILGMHPLVEFIWITYDYERERGRIPADIHPPPGKGHLAALHERHEGTLRRLTLNYTGYYSFPKAVESDITVDYFRTFMSNMPRVKHASIEAANFDFSR